MRQRGARRGLAAALIVSALALVAGGCGSDSGSSASYKQPTGPAVASLEFDGRNYSFTPKDATAPVGIISITLKSTEGGHTLVIEGVAGFKLTAAASGDSETKKVQLDKKKDYTFYCDIPGHRENGMEGTIKIT